ncbi:MAG: LysR family transcriptional regulator [Peptoniphilaceae bacterium]|nr:LysR family transcriptional regulator [Peptoniphilaceae bacterium]
MDLNRTYEYISEILEKGSISQAANALFISQPSLSQFIKRIETELSIEIFYKKKHPIQLSEAGQIYYDSLKRMYMIYENTQKHIQEMSDLQTGSVTIGALNYHSISILTNVLATFKKINPYVNVNILEGSLAELDRYLNNGEIDIAVTILPISNPNISYVRLYEEEILLAMNKDHPLTRQLYTYNLSTIETTYPEIDIHLLQKEPFIILKRGKRLRSSFNELSQKISTTPPIVLETNDVTNALVLAASGLGITLLPDTLIETLKNNFSISIFRPSESLTQRKIVAAYNHDFPLTFSAKAILDLLEDYAKTRLMKKPR